MMLHSLSTTEVEVEVLLYAETHGKHFALTCGPESSSGRASASGAVGRMFESLPRNTKGIKNGASSSFADARI